MIQTMVPSDRIIVTDSVTQRSVLGPIVFLIYMNNLPRLARRGILLFAADIELQRCTRRVQDCRLLQHDPDTLYDWSVHSKLPFNFKRCIMLQLEILFIPPTNSDVMR